MATGVKNVIDLCPGDSVPSIRTVVEKRVTIDRVYITWSDGTTQEFQTTDALPDVTDIGV